VGAHIPLDVTHVLVPVPVAFEGMSKDEKESFTKDKVAQLRLQVRSTLLNEGEVKDTGGECFLGG